MTLQADAKQEAERVLAEVWGTKLPVDPVTIARSLGLEVVDARLAPDFAGALVKEAGRTPVVLVNGSDHPNRKRFTIGHEIGHFVRRNDDEYEYVDRRDQLAAAGVDGEEIFANAFAANLLMPERDVRRLDDEETTDYEMALRFGVSQEAMNVRLAVLGIPRR